MRKEILLQIVAAVLALITIIVIGVMPGEKTDYWLPILILVIVAFILLLLASIFSVLDDRSEEDGWTGCSQLVEQFALFVLNGVAVVVLVVAVIIYIVALVNDGMTIGDTHMVQENEREANMPIGNCANINMEHPYCDSHKRECLDYAQFCMDKTNDNPSQISGMVFIVITLIVVIVTTILIIMSRADDDDGEDINNTVHSYKPAKSGSNTRGGSMHPVFTEQRPSGHTSPLV